MNREDEIRSASQVRRAQEKEALRTAILEAASEMLVQDGYDHFSLRKLASRIGYTATTIYHHFRDRDALVDAVLVEAHTRFLAALESVLSNIDDPARRLSEMGKAYVRYGLDNPTLYRLLHLRRPDLTSPESPSKIAELNDYGYQSLLREVEAAQRLGYMPPGSSQAIADHLWSGVHGLVMLGQTCFAQDRERVERALALYDMPVPKDTWPSTPDPGSTNPH